jgi:hypothetical protein
MKLRLKVGWIAVILILAALALSASARADVTVFLEEPYALDGEIAGTGHTAIYLSSVCAASPTVLRRCKPGELGVVLSRYHRIAGYDWLAIPLLPYLYAVDRPEDIPLIADVKIEAAMRDAYRRKYLENIVPDGPEGQTPPGDWYELIGSAFDRTLYGFQLPSSETQDDAFIAAYNSRPNRQAYKLVTSNCADFVRDAVNFYYPKAATRSLFADLEVATPKHVAKSLVSYAHHHREIPFSAFVIPQIPGSVKRSTPVHGVVDTVFKAKKYEIPLLVFHPFVGGGFAVAYVVSGRFNPSHDAMMFSPGGDFEQPLSDEKRRAYARNLNEMLRDQPDFATDHYSSPNWREGRSDGLRQLQSQAVFAPDVLGHPALCIIASVGSLREGEQLAGMASTLNSDRRVAESVTSEPSIAAPAVLGLTRDNILSSTVPPALIRDLMVIRLRQELSKGTSPHTSESVLRSDLDLLEKLMSADRQTVAGGAASATAAQR